MSNKESKKDFLNFFDTNFVEACRYARKLVIKPEIAEEIVQDVFTKIWQNGVLSTLDNPVGYLFRAVRNRSINYIKSIPDATFQDISAVENMAINSISTDWHTELNELNSAIEQIVASLPVRCQQIFSLSRFTGLTHKEIAIELNISTKTVENQITIALKILKKELQTAGLLNLALFLNIFKNL